MECTISRDPKMKMIRIGIGAYDDFVRLPEHDGTDTILIAYAALSPLISRYEISWNEMKGIKPVFSCIPEYPKKLTYTINPRWPLDSDPGLDSACFSDHEM